MSSLAFKVYDDQGIMQGATRDATFAATLVMHLEGGRVKHNGRIVYRQTEDDSKIGAKIGDGDAGESFDLAAETMLKRIDEHRIERARRYARLAQLPRGGNVDLARSSDRSFSS